MNQEYGELYRLYLECFPQYPIREDLFSQLLQPEKATIFREYQGDALAGFAMVHGNSISLLCVSPDCRGHGYGTRLLKQAQARLRDQGQEEVVLGQGRWYLLQGVPLENPEAVPFFQHRGYSAEWTSVNMELSLLGYDPSAVSIPPAPSEISFRLLEKSDTPALLEAVRDAQRYWLDCFTDYHGPVLAAELDGRIVGFEMVDPEGGRFLPQGKKAGSIGCVGVIHQARNQGIGLRMVLEGIRRLQEQGSPSIELLYVALVDWYRQVGFQVVRRQWMGRKPL